MVDDGSPDGTQEVVKQLQEVYGEDRIVSSEKSDAHFAFCAEVNAGLIVCHVVTIHSLVLYILQLLSARPRKMGLGMHLFFYLGNKYELVNDLFYFQELLTLMD